METLLAIRSSHDVIIKGYRVKHEKLEIPGNVPLVLLHFPNHLGYAPLQFSLDVIDIGVDTMFEFSKSDGVQNPTLDLVDSKCIWFGIAILVPLTLIHTFHIRSSIPF